MRRELIEGDKVFRLKSVVDVNCSRCVGISYCMKEGSALQLICGGSNDESQLVVSQVLSLRPCNNRQNTFRVPKDCKDCTCKESCGTYNIYLKFYELGKHAV